MKAIPIKLTHYIKMAVPLVVVVAVLGCLAGWAWHQYAPHPLGSQMEYLGKEDYGNIFGFDEAPSSDYYYGTDMSIKGVDAGYSYQTNATVISFTYDKESFDIVYYQDKKGTPFNTNKRHIISLIDEDYAPAKKALK